MRSFTMDRNRGIEPENLHCLRTQFSPPPRYARNDSQHRLALRSVVHHENIVPYAA